MHKRKRMKEKVINNGYSPASKSILIYDKLLLLIARKKRGKFKDRDFVHDFSTGPPIRIFGLSDGSLRVVSKTGGRLWKSFTS